MSISTTAPINADRLWINANLATMDPRLEAPYGALRDHGIALKEGRICWIGPSSQAASQVNAREIEDAGGYWITPGLVDSHTHLIYGGNRCHEFEQRAAGKSYQAIADEGGGILGTVAATRKLSAEALARQAMVRLQALCNEGVTTVEIKSGYGLSLEDELKMLQAARLLGNAINVHIRSTLLAAHALPAEYLNRADRYIELVCEQLIPRVAAEGLAQAVDVFCESIAFSKEQTQRVLEAARRQGLGIKLHAEQLSHQGGAALAAGLGAWSVDHGEYLDDADIAALADSDTVLCLLPGAHYFLRQERKPPVEKLRRAGVPMAVASDLNPGTSPLASLTLMLNMAVINFGLTPEEALAGATRHGAAALGLGERKGQLRSGYDADLLLWDIDTPAQICCELGGLNLVQRITATPIPEP